MHECINIILQNPVLSKFYERLWMLFTHVDKQRVKIFGIFERDCNYWAKANDPVCLF